jgi:MFS family permease
LLALSSMTSVAYYAMVTTLPVAVLELGEPDKFGWTMALFLGGNVLGMCLVGGLLGRIRPAGVELLGLVLMVGGILIAASAPVASVVVLGRLVQGVGVGVDMVMVYVLVTLCYAVTRRPRMVSLVNFCIVLPGMVAPTLAGWVAENIGWRWAMVAIASGLVPACGALVLAVRHVPRQRDVSQVNYLGGGVLAVAGLGLLQLAGTASAVVSLLCFVGGLSILVLTTRVLLPAGVFSMRPALPGQLAVLALLSAGYFGGQAWLPLMLIEVMHMSAYQAGMVLIGAPVGWGVGAMIQGRVAHDHPHAQAAVRRHVRLGAGCMVVGMTALLAAMSIGIPLLVLIVCWTLAAGGMGLAASSVTVALLGNPAVTEDGVTSSSVQIASSLSVGCVVALGTVCRSLVDANAPATGFTLILAGSLGLCLLAGAASTRMVLAPRAAP